MVEITIKAPNGSGPYSVTLTEGGSSRSYRVGVPEDFYQRLTGGTVSKADCLKASFRFLLDREPKESILSSFDLPVITRYFPEFEEKFKDYL